MLRPRSRAGGRVIAAAAAVAMTTLAACSSASVGAAAGGAAAAGATGTCGTVPQKAPGGTADLSGLPAAIAAGYNGYFQPVNTSVYAAFPARKGPYTIGYSDSFSANSWRAEALARLQSDVAAYKARGLVGALTATNSNLDNNLQIQQITSMISQHVSAIIAIPNSPTAFNGVIKQAYQAGIPFITLASHVTSPYAINVDGNYFLTGALLAARLGAMIGGHGSVLEVNGINGAPASEALSDGYAAGFGRCPGITVAGSVEGQWSEATAKTVTLQFLASHPQSLSAVINSGGMTGSIMQALQQTGRPLVPMGDANPDEGSLVALKDKLAGQYVASTLPPRQSIDMALQVAIATLQGQQPKLDTIVASPPVVTGKASLDAWVQGGWTESSANQAPAPPSTPFFPADELSAFFGKPRPLPALP